MGLVKQQTRTVFVLDRNDVCERRLVTQHAVQAFRHHQRIAASVPQSAQTFLQIRRIVMAEPDDLRSTEAASVVDAGMGVGVDEEHITLSSEGGNHPHGGEEPGSKDQGVLAIEKLRELLLQSGMGPVGSVCHARAGGSRAFIGQCLAPRLDAFRSESQAQVIVGTGKNRLAALHDSLRRRQDAFGHDAER